MQEILKITVALPLQKLDLREELPKTCLQSLFIFLAIALKTPSKKHFAPFRLCEKPF